MEEVGTSKLMNDRMKAKEKRMMKNDFIDSIQEDMNKYGLQLQDTEDADMSEETWSTNNERTSWRITYVHEELRILEEG